MTKQEIIAEMGKAQASAMAAENREAAAPFEEKFAQLERELKIMEAQERCKVAAPALTKNQALREMVKAVREHRIDGTFTVAREATDVITSAVIQAGEKTNMESAGLPLTVKDLINPLEMELIYDKLGIKVATGVRGKIQWPVLDSVIEATVGGETDEVDQVTLDFSKISPAPVKVGIAIGVSNEAIADEAFDLWGTIVAESNRSIGRVLNKRVLALSAPSAKADFVGPLVAKKQTATFAGDVPTYKEIKAIKAKVLKTGAQMAGFCYVMDAEMFSALEAQPKDAGSGRFVIEGGKIDGDLVFVTDLAAYAGKVVAGCFGYEALNQHGATSIIIDPYTAAKKNETLFIINTDWSLNNLFGGNKFPFVVAAKG